MLSSDQEGNDSSASAHLSPSAAAISTAAAVAAISGSFEQVGPSRMVENIPQVEALKATEQSNRGFGETEDISASKSNKNTTSNSNTSFRNNSQPSIAAAAPRGITFQTIPLNDPAPAPSIVGSNVNMSCNIGHSHPAVGHSFTLPQHLHFNSFGNNYSYRLQTPDGTPQIFKNMPLRRGKWTAEEETYANAVIEAFEKGTIQGCENGCTLRAYLSRKLHCQPMRISKKFAGKSIGKQVFMSRLNSVSIPVPGTNGIAGVRVGVDSSAASVGGQSSHCSHRNTDAANSVGNLRQLEFQFHMSVLQEGLGNDSLLQMGNATAHAQMQAHFQKSGNTNQSHRFLGPWPQQPTVTSGTSVNQQQTNAVPTTVPAFTPFRGADKNVTPAAVNNVQVPFLNPQIHKNLFEAFKQAQTSYLNGEIKEIAAKQNTSKLKGVGGISKTINSSQTNPVDSSQDQQNWINETMAIIPSLDPSQYTGRFSPTYTSKSFDDLHQFIGDHVPRSPSKGKVQDAIDGPATVAANRLTYVDQRQNPTLECQNRLDTACDTSESEERPLVFTNASDEYAFYAQQSAMEASKHAAYHTTSMPPSPPPQPVVKRSDTPIVTIEEMNKRANDKTKGSFVEPYLKRIQDCPVSSFSNANLKLHAAANGEGVSPLSMSGSTGSKGFNSTAMLRGPSHVVSGSERSSSSGTVRSAGESSSSPSSDNDDSASDEGQRSTGSSQSGKRKADATGDNAAHNRKTTKLVRQDLQ